MSQKVRLSVSTKGFKANSLLTVSDEVAADLVAARQAVLVGKPIEDEPEDKSGKKK